MKKIKLTKGFEALIDNKDFYILNKYQWSVRKNGNGVYAYTIVDKKHIGMHTIILPTLKCVDHKDGNGLNNQRENLREASVKDNIRNSKISRNNTSSYKGVSYHANNKTKPHRAYITCNRKRIHLGYFSDIKDAAIAYNEAAVKYFGEFARLNIV